MPYLGLFPFLLTAVSFAMFFANVSMPSLGLFPFLRDNHMDWREEAICFNALSRAIPISTPEETEKPEETEMFQCPISGYSHFYYQYRNIYKGGLNKFQCPISGYSHFYILNVKKDLQHEIVSMPYLGLFPFLRYALQRRINTAFREPFLRVIHRIF